MNTWQFSNLIDHERQSRLLAVESFSDVVQQIEQQMSVLCYHLQGCDDDLRYARSVFCIHVSEDLFDAFFNSLAGYRGSYFVSPFHGLECNLYLMKRFLPRLTSWALQNSAGCKAEFAQESLLAISAKAWLAECEKHLCHACIGEWSPPQNDQVEIVNGRWEISETPNAKYGRKAPRYTKIRLFGAFLNSHGDEFIPAGKRHRDQQIHDDGWS